MSNTWAFNQLNLLTPSPGTSPVNGTASEADRNEFSLSFPVDGTALQGQLEAWTNVNFGASFGNGNSDGLSAEEYKGMGPNDDLQQLLESNLLGVGSTFTDLYGPMPPHANAHGIMSSPSHPFLPLDFSHAAPAAIEPASAAAKKTPATAAKKRRQSSSVGSDSPAPVVVEGDDDSANALAVEEDKRRRNTAASARFRIKKKQREAALESTAKELRDKVAMMEQEVEGLKKENGWLRSLIVDKGDLAKVKKEDELSLGGAQKRARIENDGESGPEQERIVA